MSDVIQFPAVVGPEWERIVNSLSDWGLVVGILTHAEIEGFKKPADRLIFEVVPGMVINSGAADEMEALRRIFEEDDGARNQMTEYYWMIGGVALSA